MRTELLSSKNARSIDRFQESDSRIPQFPGVVLKVEVQVTFPVRTLSRNTPVMQAVLFEDPSDARFLRAWPVSQVRRN